MTKNNIAVLITCHNRKDKTLTCLEKLFTQKGIDFVFDIKVFLVDDGSTDGTSSAVAEKFPQVKILQSDGTLYWNRGMHFAWSEASKQDFDFYFWLNDDTILFESALLDMFNCTIQTQGKSIISGTTQSAVTNLGTYGGRNKEKDLIEPNGEIQFCNYFNGNCVLVPRSVYKIAGNLDYKFNHSMGDYDYGRRAARLGVTSFISGSYVGICERHEVLPKWCSPSVKLKDRIKAFKTPLAINPVQRFRYDFRHEGLLPAIKHFLTIHLRLLFPVLWEGKHKI
ncbi:MAG: glycosyltransferase family 2 protein [Ginsengibacter sp.]